MSDFKYKWFVLGDLNAFFALFLDNLVNLVILSGILIGVFGFPQEVVYSKMIPGTALGVLVGDLIYTYMAFKLAKKTQNHNVTAMPLGLDTPSTIGIAFIILGPAFLTFSANGIGKVEAAKMAWYVGMATMIVMSAVKTVTSFLGSTIQKLVPTAGLLGSLAGIGIAFLAADQFVRTMEQPIVGLLALGIILMTLIARYKLPWNMPGAAAAVIAGAFVFYVLAAFHVFGTHAELPPLTLTLSMPMPHISAFRMDLATPYIAIAIPFGFLTIIGGINVTESARLAGDDYNTRDILLTEALATFIAGLFGGVSQSTPYIGHSAYKKMGARAGYTLLTALMIGIGGWFGMVEFLVRLIPESAVAPILIFVGFEITAMAYQMSPRRHVMAVTFAIVPSILLFGYLKIKAVYYGIQRVAEQSKTILADANVPVEVAAKISHAITSIVPPFLEKQFPYLEALSQGFIITAMIWGAAVAFIIDKEMRKAMYALILGGFLSFFGVIHSATPTSEIYLPWVLNNAQDIPYKFAAAYSSAGVFLYLLSLVSKKPEDVAVTTNH